MSAKTPTAFLLLSIFLFSNFLFAQDLSKTELTYNWLTMNGNWQSLSVIAIAISVSIVALSYMAGIGLNMPEVKAWAGSELSQVFASALIIIAVVGAFTFLSTFLLNLSAGQFPCPETPGQPYAISLGSCYIDSLITVTNSTLKDNLRDAFENAKKSSERKGVSTNSKYTLWYAYYSGENAGYSIYTDRYSYNFEILSGFYTSLSAQKAFLENLASTANPQGASLSAVLIFYGIILRTFFFSRRLGGLLLAIGISLLLVWPMLYVFSWFTLKVAIFGDQMVSPAPDYCPAECKLAPPRIAGCDSLGSCKKELTGQTVLELDGRETPGQTVQVSCPSSCREIPYPMQNPSCTQADLIDEITGKIVKNVDVRALCAGPTCADECKVGGKGKLPDSGTVPYRNRTTCFLNDGYPDPQGEVETLFGETACIRVDRTEDSQSGCYADGCSIKNSVNYMSGECEGKCPLEDANGLPVCPDFCRVYYFNPLYPSVSDTDDPDDPTDGYWRIPLPSDFPAEQDGQDVWTACSRCTEAICPIGRPLAEGGAPQPNCRIGLPDPNALDCSVSCSACPQECRVVGVQGNLDVDDYFTSETSKCSEAANPACTACRAFCGIHIPEPAAAPPSPVVCAPFPEAADYETIQPSTDPAESCSACPMRCRVGNPLELPGCPAACLEPYCSPSCKSNYTTASPPSMCSACLDCDDDCTTEPQIRTNCAELCNLPAAASRDFTPSGFVSGTGGAKTTMSDIKNVGILAIPSYVLPLFNIVILIAFIRVLSQVLGGDIELPGISRII